jgi:hypothetical protein
VYDNPAERKSPPLADDFDLVGAVKTRCGPVDYNVQTIIVDAFRRRQP